MLSAVPRRPGSAHGGQQPLSPRRRWQAIIVATVVFAPACWALLAGLIALTGDEVSTAAAAGAVAFGLAVVPFVFMTLAFMTGAVGAAGAVVRAMLVTLPVGVVVSALAADAVSGIVAGVGVGAALALRSDPDTPYRPRLVAVATAAVYAFVAARSVPALLLPIAPVLPLTAIGLADHWSQRRAPAHDDPDS